MYFFIGYWYLLNIIITINRHYRLYRVIFIILRHDETLLSYFTHCFSFTSSFLSRHYYAFIITLTGFIDTHFRHYAIVIITPLLRHISLIDTLFSLANNSLIIGFTLSFLLSLDIIFFIIIFDTLSYWID